MKGCGAIVIVRRVGAGLALAEGKQSDGEGKQSQGESWQCQTVANTRTEGKQWQTVANKWQTVAMWHRCGAVTVVRSVGSAGTVAQSERSHTENPPE